MRRRQVRSSELETAEVTPLQRGVWRAQRVAWALMVLVILAALGGGLGSGPLSRRSVASADGALRVEYERFARRGAETTLVIHARPSGAPAAVVPVWFSRAAFDGVRVLSVLPPARRVQAGGDRLVWDMEVGARGSGEPLTLTVVVVPGQIGGRRLVLGLEAGPAVGFRQWVYP